jgi:hypothetical protein
MGGLIKAHSYKTRAEIAQDIFETNKITSNILFISMTDYSLNFYLTKGLKRLIFGDYIKLKIVKYFNIVEK